MWLNEQINFPSPEAFVVSAQERSTFSAIPTTFTDYQPSFGLIYSPHGGGGVKGLREGRGCAQSLGRGENGKR